MSLRSRVYILVGFILAWLSLHDIISIYQYDQYLQARNSTGTQVTSMAVPTLYTPNGFSPYITLVCGGILVCAGVVFRYRERKRKQDAKRVS